MKRCRENTKPTATHIPSLKTVVIRAKGTVSANQMALEEAGLVKQVKDGVKVLGEGTLNVALTVQANKFSKTAIEKIEAAGGKAEVI